MANENILKKTEDRIWLVKSSDSITGPFTTEELAQNVRSKLIGLLDEARTPANRWLFVRDIPEIQETISKIAQQEDTFEKTHTAATANITVTRNLDDDRTPVPVQVPLPKSNPQSHKNFSEQSSESTPFVKPALTASANQIKSYSLNPASDPIPWGRWATMAFVGLAFTAAIFSFIQRKTWQMDQRKTWAEFQQLYVAQLYVDAYKKLKEYEKEFPDQATALTRAGFLYLNPGRELVNAKRMFEKSAQLEPSNKDLMVQNLNGLGLVALYEGQQAQAKANFDRALTLEPSNILTRFNLISLNMSQGQFTEAYGLASQVASAEPKKAALIQSTLSILSPVYSEKNRSHISALIKSSDNSSYLRPIVRLMVIKLVSLQTDPLSLEVQIKQFFEDLPSLHVTFTETPVIDQRWRDWNFIYQFCSDIKGPASLEADLLAIRIVCVSEIQKWPEAERMVNEGLKRFPTSDRIKLAQLHMLTLMQRWPDVRTIMRTADLTTDTATNWMFAKACHEEKNKSCTDLYLKPLMQKSVIPTAVYDLEAKRLCSESKNDACRFAITQGLTQDPLAYDLLKIKFKIEAGL